MTDRELLKLAAKAAGIELVEQAKWARHTPARLSDADAAADLAGVARPGAEPVAWCRLTASGQIAYFDGKPMVMPGPVGNEVHPVPLYTAPQPAKQPLPDEWIRKRCAQTWIFETAKQWVRMTEQAHGVDPAQKGKP